MSSPDSVRPCLATHLAPLVSLANTAVTNVSLPTLAQGYELRTGTSFATPHVTGLVALLLETFNDLRAWEAKVVLKSLFPDTFSCE